MTEGHILCDHGSRHKLVRTPYLQALTHGANAFTLSPPCSQKMNNQRCLGADLMELEEMDVARAVVQMRYKRFGKTYTEQKGLALSPAVGEAVVNKVIYRDSDSESLDYRLIYYH